MNTKKENNLIGQSVKSFLNLVKIRKLPKIPFQIGNGMIGLLLSLK